MDRHRYRMPSKPPAGETLAAETLAAERSAAAPDAIVVRMAKFRIGEIVRHRIHDFRGVVFDVDPVFDNTEEWWLAIPEDLRPEKDQPFYHLFAENESSTYVAYVSEQNLVVDDSGQPVLHPEIETVFAGLENGFYVMREQRAN